MKKVLKITGFVLLALLIFVLCFGIFCVATEYKPGAVEKLSISTTGITLNKNQLSIVSWNIGYSGLDESADFFMDGGTSVHPESKALVQENMDGIQSNLEAFDADIYFLQEVDRSSTRTRKLDQTLFFLKDYHTRVFANNFKAEWIPYPIPMFGKMDSGVMILSNYDIDYADRVQLPIPFSWPVSMFNLKRCLAAAYMPIEGSDKKLVLVNFHLEAYDSGEGKIAQTKMLYEFLESEYAKGNYVVAGGDFNQSFPGALDAYPLLPDDNLWAPGNLDVDSLKEGWQVAYDLSSPSCRSLDKAYNGPEGHQFYLIDGFLLSPNITLDSVVTTNLEFRYSDHNPVVINITLQ